MKLALAVVLALSMGAAFAQESLAERVAIAEIFEALDADGDGAISRLEAVASVDLSLLFNDVDQNGDGQLTLAEFRALMLAPVEEVAPSN